MSDPILPPRTRVEGHPAPLALEECAFDPEHAAPEAIAHVAACDTCRGTVEGLRAERDAFVLRRPAKAFVARLQDRGRTRRIALARWFGGFGLAAAAAVLVLLVRPVDEGTIARKGAEGAWQVLVSRGGSPAVPWQGEALVAGDVLRFRVDAPAGAYLLLASLDADQHFSLYFPANAPESAPVPAGQGVLPGSVVLDDAVGDEQVIAVWSDRPIAVSAVEAALRAGGTTPLPEGARSSRLVLPRRPR